MADEIEVEAIIRSNRYDVPWWSIAGLSFAAGFGLGGFFVVFLLALGGAL